MTEEIEAIEAAADHAAYSGIEELISEAISRDHLFHARAMPILTTWIWCGTHCRHVGGEVALFGP
jgi:hypothetical protein